jgi:hypothetical protein
MPLSIRYLIDIISISYIRHYDWPWIPHGYLLDPHPSEMLNQWKIEGLSMRNTGGLVPNITGGFRLYRSIWTPCPDSRE